ncbi:MAG: glycoside hydrolase family 3 C-terminal domain-containing protein [Bacteroides sp.]|nr:glycoside hydrolase family 3 C-terminal domain-containing protein [Bacteroides sp.]MBQ8225782.1 glycoside hydrolase family 3 C-terminal domain-containing protein [Bacteroides sp.]
MKSFASLLLFLLAFQASYAAKPLKLRANNIDKIVKALTLEEKVHLIVGASMSERMASGEVGYTDSIVPGAAGITYQVERLGIPTIVFADGPAGLHISATREGDPKSYYCTGFPVGTHLAATWNEEIIYRVGEAMGNEVKEYGVDVILAPGVNIMRNPLCGRNFEYYSEDPLLSGKTAAAIINGIESNGVGTSIKHFAANNQEINRLGNDSRVSLRALREIYLRNFEIAIRNSQPWTLMTSYNYLNGRYTSEDRGLLETVLRDEFGFEGTVVTDWGGGLDPVAQVASGNDMIQPGDPEQYEAILKAVREGRLDEQLVDVCVKRILKLIVKTPSFNNYQHSNNPDLQAHAQVTREVASEGFVLLKNEVEALPMKAGSEIALFGVGSYDFIAGGRGSGDVNKAYVVDLREGLLANNLHLDAELDKQYTQHIQEEKARIAPMDAHRRWTVYTLRPNEIRDPRTLVQGSSKRADLAIVTISRHAAEGFERHVERDFNLRIDERALLNEVSREFRAAGKPVVVVLNVSGPVEIASWRDKADAILVCWMPGQEGGNSVADVLLGRQSPSGHLPMSFPMSYADVPSQNFPVNVPENGLNQSFENFSRVHKYYDQPNIDYTNYEEDIYVGYRHYATRGVEVAYPFGYGLTYSAFNLTDMKVEQSEQEILVSCLITNTGKHAAKQVVQLYSTELAPSTDRPLIELRGYSKTPTLQPGESHTVTIRITPEDLATYSEADVAWKLSAGDYRLSLGFSSSELLQTKDIHIQSEKLRPVSDILKPDSGEIFIK